MVYQFTMIEIQELKYEHENKNVYTNFCGLNVPEDVLESESFSVICINSFLVYENKDYLQIYLDNWAYKIKDKQMTNYHDENPFDFDKWVL